MQLSGKVALVTGAGRGIGRAIAAGFAREGAAVCIVDIDRNLSNEAVAALRNQGHRAVAHLCDLSKVADIPPMIEAAVMAFGRLDILVNNAGIGRAIPWPDVTEEHWDRLMALNTKAVFFATQLAAQQMIAQGDGGKIINISSIAGRVGRGFSPVYSASKTAVISLTQSAAQAFARHGINVNAICPGVVDTELTAQYDADITRQSGQETGSYKAAKAAEIPMGRLEVPEDLVGAAIFLASPMSVYMTGQALNVCGGLAFN